MVQQIFWVQKSFKKKFWSKKIDSKKILGPKIFWKNLDPTKMWVQKRITVHKIFIQKKIWSKNILVLKNVGLENNGSKHFGSKKICMICKMENQEICYPPTPLMENCIISSNYPIGNTFKVPRARVLFITAAICLYLICEASFCTKSLSRMFQVGFWCCKTSKKKTTLKMKTWKINITWKLKTV